MSDLVKQAMLHTDMLESSLDFIEAAFRDAHKLAPGGLSIEIGTYHGGSALLQLKLLEEIYPQADRPYFFTVDPYGWKPYNGGDTGEKVFALYNNDDFVMMKTLLASYPNHMHWYLSSTQFLSIAPFIKYWRNVKCYGISDVSFAFLDGDHDAVTIGHEVRLLLPLMHKNGIILIDNVDKDVATKEVLEKYGDAVVPGPASPWGANQVKILLERVNHGG